MLNSKLALNRTTKRAFPQDVQRSWVRCGYLLGDNGRILSALIPRGRFASRTTASDTERTGWASRCTWYGWVIRSSIGLAGVNLDGSALKAKGKPTHMENCQVVVYWPQKVTTNSQGLTVKPSVSWVRIVRECETRRLGKGGWTREVCRLGRGLKIAIIGHELARKANHVPGVGSRLEICNCNPQ
jgi:hypothetical protein